LTLLAGALGVPGCSSEPEELDDPDPPPVASNPDGIPYPTDNLGPRERGPGRRGDRIPNFTFRGYRDPRDRSAGLTTLALADFYDPGQKRNKVLHIQIAATWCAICSGVISGTVPVANDLRRRGAALLEVVVSGDTLGKGPSLAEVDAWVVRHGSNVATAVDVRGRRLATVGVSTSVVPHDILIDTRTMEILDSSVGAPLDVSRYVEDGLRFVEQNRASY
jgi:hypothetical protein